MPDLDEDLRFQEADVVFDRRLQEALDSGMDELSATEYAASQVDCGMLRKLVADGCPAGLLREILL